MGSFTGGGTRRTPPKAACRVTPCPDGGATAEECFSAGEAGACVDIFQLYSRNGPRGGAAGSALAIGRRMSDHQKSDSGKGIPPSGEGTTAETPAHDPRLIPGGSFDAAKTPVGMNAVDREDLPSYGKATDQVDYKDTPETDAQRPPHPEEPGSPASTAGSPGIPRGSR